MKNEKNGVGGGGLNIITERCERGRVLKPVGREDIKDFSQMLDQRSKSNLFFS